MLYTNIDQMATYYGLTPQKMKTYHIFEHDNSVTIWQKGKASLHYLKDSNDNARYKNVSRMSYDGGAKAAYQIAVNILHDEDLKRQFADMGVTI